MLLNKVPLQTPTTKLGSAEFAPQGPIVAVPIIEKGNVATGCNLIGNGEAFGISILQIGQQGQS